jgi:putative hydrolase of the HAD superfamily
VSEAALRAGVTAITFDAGGTLLHPHPSVGLVYREVAARHGRDYDTDELETRFRAAFKSVSKDPRVLDPEARERDFWSRVVRETIPPDRKAPDDFDAFFAELFESFAHASRWRVFPQAEKTLGLLAARGYRLGVLSNWDRRLRTVLAETGLERYFHAVLISSEVGVEKPDAGIFRAAERALGAKPSACLHVGDSRKHDLEGAHAAGWKALLVRHEDGARDPHEISFLPDLIALLG